MSLSFTEFAKYNGLPILDTHDQKSWKETVKKECLAIIQQVNDGKPLARCSDEEYYYETSKKFGIYGVVGQSHGLFRITHEKWCVYRMTNLKTGKVYHGHTNNPPRRILEHCECTSDAVADKEMTADFLGIEKACSFEILFICDTKDEAREIEKSYNEQLIKGKVYAYNKIR